MKPHLEHIQQLIDACQPQQAITEADDLIEVLKQEAEASTMTANCGPYPRSEIEAKAYLLRGHAYRQLNNWQMAINSYLAAQRLQPDGPASQALATIREILNFYHHDLYNP